MNKQIFFFIIALLVISPLAPASANSLLIAEITLPSRPIPPSPPSVGRIKEDQSNKNIPADKKSSAELKQNQEQSTPAKQQTTDTPPPLPKNTTKVTTTPKRDTNEAATMKKDPHEATQIIPSAQQNLVPDTEENELAEKQQEQVKETWQEKWLTPSAKNTIYTILAVLLSAGIAYFYLTTPKDMATAIKATTSRRPLKQQVPHTATRSKPTTPAKPQPKEPSPLAIDNKIKNTSLLEQLIKYDMENYGELRSNLDYEQPAYVEKLIRKYGGDDKNKINRAINLFYISRNN